MGGRLARLPGGVKAAVVIGEIASQAILSVTLAPNRDGKSVGIAGLRREIEHFEIPCFQARPAVFNGWHLVAEAADGVSVKGDGGQSVSLVLNVKVDIELEGNRSASTGGRSA